jgi:hypothetical protein
MGQVKTLDEIKAMIRARTGKRNVFRRAKKDDVEAVLVRLTDKDPELWAAEWARAAEPYENEAAARERAGDGRAAMEAHLMAYVLHDRPVSRAAHGGKAGVLYKVARSLREGRPRFHAAA